MEDSVRRKLTMQNEVLKWLEDFSEKLQKRADATTVEVLGLLDQTEVVERDLKNTFNSFRNLSYHRFIENKISEEKITDSMKEDIKNSVHAGIPAQSYEVDILPRYKEALSLGLSSYKHHLQKTKITASTGSVFKIGSARGPLPHIIGSEEYIHDNSCGLAIDNFMSDAASLDFRHAVEPNSLHSSSGESGSHARFNADLFGMEQGPSEKDGIEPLVSAALDFKAMLEAALLSPYKFYDEDSPSLPDAVSGYNNNVEYLHAKDHATSTVSSTDVISKSQHRGIEDAAASVADTAGNLTFFQDSDIHRHKLCSAFLSDSLFDTEEESVPSNQQQSDCIPTSTAEVVSSLSVSTSGLSFQESWDVSSSNEKENASKEVPPEIVSTFREDIASNSNSLSSSDCGDRTEFSKRLSGSDCLVSQVPEEGKPSGSSSVTFHDSFNHEIALDHAMQRSLPLPAKVVFDDFDSDDDNDLPKPVHALGHQVMPKTAVVVVNSDTSHAIPTCEFSPSSAVGGLVSEIQPKSTSSIFSVSSSMIANTESSSPPREFAQNKLAKSVINEMPRQEEPTFSTVVSVSQEPGSLFLPATLNRFPDLDACSSSSKGNTSGGSSLEEITEPTESCNVAQLPYRQLQASMVVGEPSIVRIKDDSVAGSVQHFSVPGETVGGGPSLDTEESKRFQYPSSEKSCKLDSAVNDLLEAEDVQHTSTTQVEQHGDQGASSNLNYRSAVFTEGKKDDTALGTQPPEGKRSVIESLLKLPVRRPSLFDSNEE
ncbi:uncharacterized protein LOC131235148 isoform X2 [Magnolia sinica]|uniref:uncharacterized protein LOC131235148 isoform X2 n=1 Tax=Magnolia sinica TaxID=86752 RepID=UPI0026590BA9|nr:uncharacterized protein LOC131235148 isoform X2 [Magnolia sinica]